MNALESYNIVFARVIRANHSYFDISSVNDWLSIVIQDHRSISEATRLLNGINKAINENWQYSDWGFPTQGLVIAVVDVSITRVYEDLREYANDKSIAPSFTLPTSDFKEIVEA